MIESYRSETAKKQAEVAALTDEDQPRVFQVTICSACGGQLDLPSVHFMCKHSYHHRCLVENETECPTCARAHTTVRDIRRANQRAAEHHDLSVNPSVPSFVSAASLTVFHFAGFWKRCTRQKTDSARRRGCSPRAY